MTDASQPKIKQAQQVLIVGCGRMGGALLSRWLHVDDFEFTVISPSGTRSFPDVVRVARGPEALGNARFDLIVIGVKPQQIREAMPAYIPHLAPGGAVLSLAAGTSVASLTDVLGPVPICRVMPNLPVSLGQGVSALYADAGLHDDQAQRVDALMRPTGTLVWVDSEDELDRVTAIAGSGPGYAFEIARCWVDAGKALGLPADVARQLVLGTLRGSVNLAIESGDSLDSLRDGVTSKHGTTQAGLEALNGNSQLGELFQSTVAAAYARAQALR